MGKKLTIGFVREQFEKEGYILLTEVYINAHQKLDYTCPKNHKGKIDWHHWQQGKRCAECSGKKKYTIEFIKEQFKKEGYRLLTKKYINCFQRLKYICPNGHKSWVQWHNWQYGARCVECVGLKKLTIEFIKKKFEEEGYKLLTKKYINSKQKLNYICPEGHNGTIKWCSWRQGQRCRKCYLKNNKGSNHPNWNPSLTDKERRVKRKYLEYTNWAIQVKERDKFTCQICDQVGYKLVSHHLESYNNNPDLRTTLSNGVCLCEKCHKSFHHQYGCRSNTKEQFIEFINKYNKQEKSANV
jgi:hypothetical protein